MNKRKIIKPILLILTSSILSSCDIFEGIVFFDSSEIEYDIAQNLDILNEAFNGQINNKGESLRLDYSEVSFEKEPYTTIDYNVTDLEYNDGGLPSVGNINSLVIPIDFSDYPARKIECENIHMDYQSVSSFFYNSSYGKLDITFDVLPYVRLSKPSRYYENPISFYTYSGECPGVSLIIEEVFSKLDSKIDFSKYDNDDDGYIDSFYLIYSTPYDEIDYDFWWAYQYYYYEDKSFDGVIPYYYVFASYDFLFDSGIYEISAETFIHETGHLLNIEDYYDYDADSGYNKGGLGGVDMQDSNLGDHNPFTKMSLGWINPILVNVEDLKYKEYTIKSFCEYGDTLMICDNFDLEKGIFQDYFLITYFNKDSLLNSNIYDNDNNLIYNESGIKVYRVHGELTTYEDDYSSYEYFKYDNSYTDYNIIDSIIYAPFLSSTYSSVYSSKEYLDICASDTDLYKKDDYSGDLFYYDRHGKIESDYSFKVSSINQYSASIKLYKKAIK